jgi:hypothetical protein
MKSRRAIATACHLFALASSSLLVKCSSTTCKVSVFAFFSPDDLIMTSYRCPAQERPGSSGQTSLVAATSQSVSFSRSLATHFQARQPHLHTRVCQSEWGEGGRTARARWSLARRTYSDEACLSTASLVAPSRRTDKELRWDHRYNSLQ